MALNDKSAALLAHWKELDTLFANNQTALGSIIVVGQRYHLNWQPDMLTTNDYVDTANGTTVGITHGKNIAKDAVSTLGGDMAGMGQAYAITKEDLPELELKMSKFTFSSLRHNTNDADVAGRIKDIFDTLKPFITSDPIVSAEFYDLPGLLAIMTGSTVFTGKLGKYKNQLDAIDVGKENFVKLMKPKMQKTIVFFELFMNTLYDFYPEFVDAFRRITKKVDELGKKNQGVLPTLYNAETGELIGTGGLMTPLNYIVTKKSKILKTNSMSSFGLMKMKVGTWKIKYSIPGYYPVTITYIVKARKVITVSIMMVPIPPPPL